MNNILTLFFLFFIGSAIGWGIETVFRRFCRENKTRKWINPGFLIGPYLPLYGFGLCSLYLLAEAEKFLPFSNPAALKATVVVLMAICMTLLELIAGLIFVCGMNVKLWDYSNKKFNYKGIICPEFSFYWLLLASVYYLLIHPKILSALEWFSSNLAFSFVLGAFFGVFVIDFCYSMQIATKIRRFAADNDILVRYEELKSNIRRYAEESKEKYLFMFAFRSKVPLHEHLSRYFKLQQAFKKHKNQKSDDEKER